MQKTTKLALATMVTITTLSCNLPSQNLNKETDKLPFSEQNTGKVNITIDKNLFIKQGFKVKGVDFTNSSIKKLKFWVKGLGIVNELSDTKDWTPGQTVSFSLNVPAGTNRIIHLYALDTDGNTLGNLMGALNVDAGKNNNGKISHFETAVAQVLENILNSKDSSKLNSINLVNLRNFVKEVTGYDEATNSFSKVNPSSINTEFIANSIITNNGALPASNLPILSGYGKVKVNLNITGARIILSDLNSMPVTNTDLSTTISNVSTGNCFVTIKKDGYITQSKKVSIGVSDTPVEVNFTILEGTKPQPSPSPSSTQPPTGSGTVTTIAGAKPATGGVFTGFSSTTSSAGMGYGYFTPIPSDGVIIAGTYTSSTITFKNGTIGYYKTDGYSDGNTTNAKFKRPSGVATDKNGNIFVADSGNAVIRKITPNGDVTTIAGGIPITIIGNGTYQKVGSGGVYCASGETCTVEQHGYVNGNGTNARFKFPNAIAVDDNGDIYVSDSGNNAIRKITPNGDVTTIAGGLPLTITGNGTSQKVGENTVYCPSGETCTVDQPGYVNGNGTNARFRSPLGLTIDKNGNIIVADASNNAIRKITPNGDVTTLVGSLPVQVQGSSSSIPLGTSNVYCQSGTTCYFGEPGDIDANGTNARIGGAFSVTTDSSGTLYFTDGFNRKIKKVSSDGTVSTISGGGGVVDAGLYFSSTTFPASDIFADGNSSTARFFYPTGLTVDSSGNIYVTDVFNSNIRKVTPSGDVTTIAGFKPTKPIFMKVCLDSSLPSASSCTVISSVSGTNPYTRAGFEDGVSSNSLFMFPIDIKTDKDGNLIVVDYYNNLIRKITL